MSKQIGGSPKNSAKITEQFVTLNVVDGPGRVENITQVKPVGTKRKKPTTRSRAGEPEMQAWVRRIDRGQVTSTLSLSTVLAATPFPMWGYVMCSQWQTYLKSGVGGVVKMQSHLKWGQLMTYHFQGFPRHPLLNVTLNTLGCLVVGVAYSR